VSSFTGKLIVQKCCWAPDTQKTGNRAKFVTEYHHIGLHSPACKYKCAAGSPKSSTTAARGMFSRNNHAHRLGAALKRHRQHRGRQRERRSRSKWGVTQILWRLPPRARSLNPATAKFSQRWRSRWKGRRRTYTPHNSRDKTQNTSPMICVRFYPGACCPVRAHCNPVRARCNPVRAHCNPAQAGLSLGKARFRT